MCAIPGYQESAASPSSYKLSLEDAVLQKKVGEWFRVIGHQSSPDDQMVGVAVTINGRL
jgi:hypothetical protein